jgi:2-oxo-4-hydroxy-4-carboxy-5-ureidoimidazoline decarboxylase
MSYSIADLNQMSQAALTEALGAVFEDTPAIARQTWHQRPFADRVDLHQKMVDVVRSLSQEEQLALIRAHPDLGSKAKMAGASIKEQTGAGLDQLTPSEYERFQALNQQYQAKFGFPFVIAVKDHTKISILDAFEQRLEHSIDLERAQALTEIVRIAEFRLFDWIEEEKK